MRRDDQYEFSAKVMVYSLIGMVVVLMLALALG